MARDCHPAFCHLSPATQATYDGFLRRWTEDGATTPPQVAAWLTEQLANPELPRGTASPMRAAVKAWLAHMGRPDLEIPTLRGKRQRSFRGALDDDELKAWEDALVRSSVPEPVFGLLWILPYTGLRVSEAARLRHDKFRRQRGHLGVDVVGKGRHGGKARWVPLIPEVVEALTETATHVGTSDWCFPSPRDLDRPITTGAVRYHVRKLREGLPGYLSEVSPHVFRHTAATRMLARGVPVAVVKDALGHADIATTAAYLHPGAKELAEGLGSLSR